MIDGLITPIVTPFKQNQAQEINYSATKKLIDHLIEKGVDGIFALGSNGEFNVLTNQEKIKFVERVIEYTDKRVPVYAGTGTCSTVETIYLSKEMEKLGVDGISVISPYFVTLNENELVEHYKAVAESVNISVILYNIPRLTGNPLTPSIVSKLAPIENIVCVKDSSRDMENLKAYVEIANKNNMTVLVGSDSVILEGMKAGADGAIAGLSNLLTTNLVKLYRASKNKDYVEAEKWQTSLQTLSKVNRAGTMPSVLKRSVELADIARVGAGRLPVQEPSTELDQEIKEMLVHYELL